MNIAALEKAKQTIAVDPEFNLGTYDHCIARHLCDNDPDTVVIGPFYAFMDNVPTFRAYTSDGDNKSIASRAYEILGGQSCKGQSSVYDYELSGLFNGGGPDPKVAIERIDRFIAQHRPVEQEVEELELASV